MATFQQALDAAFETAWRLGKIAEEAVGARTRGEVEMEVVDFTSTRYVGAIEVLGNILHIAGQVREPMTPSTDAINAFQIDAALALYRWALGTGRTTQAEFNRWVMKDARIRAVYSQQVAPG
jgi:hypothetical protein